jgi:hypothetical protein
MKQKLLIFGVFALLIAVMIGLNAVSYVQKTTLPDNEMQPNRSSFHPGATGTLALYTLLAESGVQVSRWQRPPGELAADENAPKTLVMVGSFRRPVAEDEARELLTWVARGGRLVLIDRDPPKQLLEAVWGYQVSLRGPAEGTAGNAIMTVDPASQPQMTVNTAAVRPLQPTPIAFGVNAVQPSRFAGSVVFARNANVDWVELYEEYGDKDEEEEDEDSDTDTPPITTPADPHLSNEPAPTETPYNFYFNYRTQDPPPPPAPYVITSESDDIGEVPEFLAGPVVHLGTAERALLTELPHGSGTIMILADPFIVSNGGIGMADNVRLAVNLITAAGPSAFNEYHHGYSAGGNRVIEYFDGTPVIAMLLQLIAVGALVIYSRSRRFARPVPGGGADRLSKLEYIDAMAELQQRTSAYDLALENIYGDFRRRTARSFGVDNMTTPRGALALMIAERTGRGVDDVEKLMIDCEDVIHGSSTSKAEVLRLAAAIRDLEAELGIARTRRRM